MYTFFLIIHILVSLGLILVILLQSGKGGGLAGAFGGGGESGTVFGSRGATSALGKATTILAVLFMLISILLTFMSGTTGSGKSVLKEQLQKEGTTAPLDVPQPLQPTTTPQAPAVTPTTSDQEGQTSPQPEQKQTPEPSDAGSD